MNQIVKFCGWCEGEFKPKHGNDRYCCIDHEDAARRFRQAGRYNAISPLLPILYRNHQILESLFDTMQITYTSHQLESAGIDFSLHRRLYPDPENELLIRLDFGAFFLESTDNLRTFKLAKYGAQTS
jgi:hypothetical protein